MQISNNGIKLIKSFEGCILQSYDDYNDKIINENDTVKGTLTIGYGTTRADLPGLYKGMRITQSQADDLFIKHLQRYVNDVNSLNRNFNQNQFDALVSFHYNTGSVKTLCNGRNIQQIADKMLEYKYSCGKIFEGLVKRREAERKLFLTPVANNKAYSYHIRDLQIAYNKSYRKNIGVDGIYGPETNDAIHNIILKQGMANDLVAWVQIRIGAKVDGIFGKNTKSKVIEYQRIHGLVTDGIVGVNTIKAILKQYKAI